MKASLILATLALAVTSAVAQDYDYPTRRPLIVNVCPALKIESFTFKNAKTFQASFSWANVGTKDIVAFELKVLRYDPFNRAIAPARTQFPGHNSADYTPLKPGDKDNDGASWAEFQGQTFSAFAYVNAVRFGDGTVWHADPKEVAESMRKQAPEIVPLIETT